MIKVDEARQIRARINMANRFYLSNNSALSDYGKSLDWMDLERLPEWCLWDNKNIQHLVLIAGTVFVLPSVRLWIKSEQIQKVRSLIGEEVYEFLVNYTYKDIESVKHPFIEDIEKTLVTTGSTVIYSSIDQKIHPWLINIIHKTDKKLNNVLATEILKHAIFVKKQTEISLQKTDTNTEEDNNELYNNNQ